MTDSVIGNQMYDEALNLLNSRYGNSDGGVGVVRIDNGDYLTSPCGVCQERLFFFGENVKCAITNKENKIIFKTLKELQPYYWKK